MKDPTKRTSRALAPFVVASVAASVLLGCPLLKKKPADAGAEQEEDIADAATVTVSGSGAKNEGDVLRYAKEVKLDNEPGVIGKDDTVVRTFPVTGLEVATLSKDTPVTKMARYFSTGVLVTFDDAAGGGKLMGWIPPEALAPPAAASATATATATAPTWKPPKIADAGAKVDAGGTAKPDAGAPAAPAAPDAGKPAEPKPQSTAQLFVPPGPGNKCPAGYALIGGGCRKPCKADGDCPRGTFCVPNAGKKACATSR